MRIFKNRLFHRWAADEKLSDEALRKAVEEISNGLVEANLGGSVYKKRVASQGRGKSGGVRTLIAFRVEDKAFFMYGFAKNQRDNIKDNELKALKTMASELLGYSNKVLAEMIKQGKLVEVENNE
jgi:hypothetical protein